MSDALTIIALMIAVFLFAGEPDVHDLYLQHLMEKINGSELAGQRGD